MAAHLTHPRISSHVVPVLRSGVTAGVRGLFSHGLNLVTADGQLVYLGSFDKPLSCVGAQVPQDALRAVLRRVEPGDEALLAGASILFLRGGAPVASLGLDGAEVVSLSLTSTLSAAAGMDVVRALDSAGVASGTGLEQGPELEAAMDGLAAALGPWRAGQSAQAADGRLHDSVRWLLGRGPGLTPSGDDMLCGFGAACLALGRPDAHRMLCGEISRVRSTRTTTYVSDAYLDAMASGCVNEGMLALLSQASMGGDLAPAIAMASDYGHTSGCDMLLGLAAGLSAAIHVHQNRYYRQAIPTS